MHRAWNSARTTSADCGSGLGRYRCSSRSKAGALMAERPNGLRITKYQSPTSPGALLLEEFLKPRGMTQTELATQIRVPYVRVNEIVNGKRRVTPSTALRLAKVFGTSAEFWLSGQLALDLYRTINDKKEIGELEQIDLMRP